MKSIFTAVFLGAVTAAHAQWTLAFRKTTATLPGGAEFVEREAKGAAGTVRAQGVFLTAKQGRFAVVDNAGRASLGAAMASAGALAGANGGYFHPDWKPAGLVIAEGRKVHPFERAKLLSGVFVVTKGQPRIVRSAAYTPSKADTEALQAGPFLVEKGAPVAGLNDTKTARRTVIATDGKGRWALLTLSPATLADAAELLASREVFPDFPVAQALNLDGGSSTALWVAAGGRPFYSPEFGRVRNFLALLPR